MNVTVKHDGTDITNWILSYDREHNICTGVASLEVQVPTSITRTFHPWDVIEVWENSNKKGKFYVSNLEENAQTGILVLDCDDESKRLTDYFITDSYLIDYLSYSKPWITKFLDEAGVNYTFTVSGEGVPLSNNTNLGFDSAYSVITTLLQQSGWYIYFDETGTAIIGDLNKDVNNPDHSITGDDFSEFQRELDDDRLRNRAVVWGNSNPTYGEVFVDISVQTPWNYDAQDERAVVIANSAIFSNDQALTLAQKLLKEFTQIKDEKYLLVLNDYNMKLGEIVKVTSNFWSGRGLITGINATMSQDGLVYGITLDQKCPRLFTFYSNLPPTVSGFYVYTGHISDGIWKKQTEGSTWYQDSAGLEVGAKVDDLFIRNGTFATVLNDGYLYTRTVDGGTWNKYYHGSLRDVNGNVYPEEDLKAVACSINMSDNVIAGYNYVPSGAVISGYTTVSGLSWVLELTGAQSLIKAEQVVISGGAGDGHRYLITDLEATGEYNIVTTAGISPASGYIAEAVYENSLFGSGHRDIMFHEGANSFYNVVPADRDSLALGFGYGDHTPTRFGGTYTQDASGLVCDPITQIYWYAGRDGLVKVDPSDQSSTLYPWADKTEWIGVLSGDFDTYLRHESGNNFKILVVIDVITDKKYEFYLYSYTLGGSLTDVSSSTIDLSSGHVFGSGLSGNTFTMTYYTNETYYAKQCNLTTGSWSDVRIVGFDDYIALANYTGGFTATEWTASYGGGIVHAFIHMIGTNGENLGPCPFFQGFGPKNAELWITSYVIDKNGSATIVGPAFIDSWDLHENSTHFDFYSYNTGPLPGDGVGGTNSLLQKHYRIIPISFRHKDCGKTGEENFWRGLTLGISFPDHSLFYSKWSDNDAWWATADSYVSNSALEMVDKPAGSSPNSAGSEYGHVYAKYGGVVGSVWNSGADWFEVRGLPNWGTLYWRGTGADPTPDHFPHNYGNICDFTGQAVNGADGTYNYQAIKSDLNNWTTRIETNSILSSYITQHYLVTYHGNYYYFYALSYDQTANFPMGTVLKHTSTTDLGSKITASDNALEQTLGVFQVIHTTQVPVKVDIAKDTPTVIYDIPETLGDNSTEFAASVTNTPNSFYTHTDVKPVYEARNFDLPKPGTFPTISGTFNPLDYERYVGIANQQGILASEWPLNTPWVNMVTATSGVPVSGVVISGLITHFETSNYVPEGTYFFYTVSGVKTFYQKNPTENFWRDYSAGLPNSDITIIRVDDVI